MRGFLIVVLFGLFAVAHSQFRFANIFGNNNNNRVRNNSGGGCRNSGPNHTFNGRRYILSWLNGCTSFSAGAGDSYCRRNGMRAVSLDTREKANHFIGVVGSHRQKYFWTGGNINGNQVTWNNGVRQHTNGMPWSRTGGANRPQPDNREGNEFCIAVLNNFYNDGIVFHDVSCHHTKPVICEG